MSEPQCREPMHECKARGGAGEEYVAADNDPARPFPLLGARVGPQNGAGRQAEEEADQYGHAERVTKMSAVKPDRTEDDGADGNMWAVGRRGVLATSERAHVTQPPLQQCKQYHGYAGQGAVDNRRLEPMQQR